MTWSCNMHHVLQIHLQSALHFLSQCSHNIHTVHNFSLLFLIETACCFNNMQPPAGGWDKHSTAGKHSSSMLVQTIASEGLADAFMAFNTNYHDSGLFGVYGVTDRDRCEDFAASIMSSLTKMCFDVREADVVRAKNQLKASLMFFQDSTHREWSRWVHMGIGWTFSVHTVQSGSV